MKNTNFKPNRTLLVCEKVDFSYKINDTDRKTESDRYYTIALGENFQVSAGESNVASELLTLRGVTGNDGKYNGLYRNLQYDLTLTVTGPGYQILVVVAILQRWMYSAWLFLSGMLVKMLKSNHHL